MDLVPSVIILVQIRMQISLLGVLHGLDGHGSTSPVIRRSLVFIVAALLRRPCGHMRKIRRVLRLLTEGACGAHRRLPRGVLVKIRTTLERVSLSPGGRPRFLGIVVVWAREIVGRWLSTRDHGPLEAELAVGHVLAGFAFVVGRMEEPLELVGGIQCIVGKLAVAHVTVKESAPTLARAVRAEAGGC